MSKSHLPTWERRERLIPPLSPLPVALVAFLASIHGSFLSPRRVISLGTLYAPASVLLSLGEAF